MFARSRWAIVRKDLPTIKRNVVPAFEKVREDGFGDHVGPLHKGDWTYRTINGSEIMLFPEGYKDDKEYNRWRGLEVCGFLFEECNELEETTFTKGLERAGSWIVPGDGPQPDPIILMTCNPTKTWPKTMFYDKWKSGTLQEPYLYIPAQATDNPYLPQAYLESLESMREHSPLAFEKFVKGNWDVSEGDVFRSKDFKTQRVNNMSGWTLGLFGDIAYTKKAYSAQTYLILAGVDAGGRKHCFRTWNGYWDEGESIDLICRIMKEYRATGFRPKGWFEAHSAWFYALREKMKHEGLDFQLEELKTGGVSKVDRILNRRHNLHFWTYDPDCQGLINQHLDFAVDIIDSILVDGVDINAYADLKLVYIPGQESEWVPPKPDVTTDMGRLQSYAWDNEYGTEFEERERPL